MVAGNIQERIKKMKEAILMQAKQRAHTTVESASQEADQERAKFYNTEKEKIVVEFALLAKNEKIKDKIERSALNNRHRIMRMQVRYEFVEKLREQVNQRLRSLIQNEVLYKDLTKKLIVQGMIRFMERHVTVELKAAQIPLAEAEFAECERSFTEIVLNATGKAMESKLTISEYRLEEKNEKIIGGVFLRSNDGVIVCDNSLDSRVRLVFEQLLPNIRNSLFPKRGP